jgi:TolB-like protein/DNA-binding winged helix-turn-helix (wHTH) protein/Tfp pilus assembly protein PilF
MSGELLDQFYEFGPFRLDRGKRLLWRDGEVVSLSPKAFDTLLALIEKRGELLDKDTLMQTLWPDSFVEEANLTVKVSQLRRALGELPHEHQYIVTVPGRGYRFVAEVRIPENLEVEPVVPVELTKPEPRRSRLFLVIAAAFLLIAGVTVAIFFISNRRSTVVANTSAPIRSIAVLPLQNLSGDPAQEYFADGMTESLISNLAQIHALKVISRTSVMRYKNTTKSLPEIARELNVDAVIEGAVQRSGDRVRITAQLIQAPTDTHVWARNYERDQTDVLKLESEVAQAVADEIRIQLTAEERSRLGTSRSIDPQAHEAYLLGRHHFSKGTREGWKQSIQYFETAIRLAPDFAAAYAGLSDSWLNRGIFELNFKDTDTAARAAAMKAVELDGQLAEAHIALGNVKFNYDWDWNGAEQEFMRALELDPGNLRGHSCYGFLLMAVGRHDEAIREGRRAVELDPLSSEVQSALGRFLYRGHRVEEAVPPLQRAIELEPQDLAARFRLGEVFTQLRKYDEALLLFGEKSFGAARVYALTGRKQEALEIMRGVNEPPISIAAVYAALGDKDKAFQILQKAVDNRTAHLVYLKEDPPLETLHSDPRWQALIQRMKFPPG